jgi:transposase
MLSFLNAKIWLYLQPIDFRKQRDGLIVEVAANLKKDPASGQWFIFRNKQGNKIKIILWEQNGFWMLYKRVEKGRFQFPRNRDETHQLKQLQRAQFGSKSERFTDLFDGQQALFESKALQTTTISPHEKR